MRMYVFITVHVRGVGVCWCVCAIGVAILVRRVCACAALYAARVCACVSALPLIIFFVCAVANIASSVNSAVHPFQYPVYTFIRHYRIYHDILPSSIVIEYQLKHSTVSEVYARCV